MPAVEAIDHVHLEVRDREDAADWYADILGLKRHAPFAAWADDPNGPLFLATASGASALALFSRPIQPGNRDSTVAFRLSGESFLAFLDELLRLNLRGFDGRRLVRDDAVDHGLSWSIYFVDPDGNRLEITTYDYAMVRKGR